MWLGLTHTNRMGVLAIGWLLDHYWRGDVGATLCYWDYRTLPPFTALCGTCTRAPEMEQVGCDPGLDCFGEDGCAIPPDLPSAIGTLEAVDWSSARLRSDLPDSGWPQSLRTLRLGGNPGLSSGPVPEGFALLEELTILNLSDTARTGPMCAPDPPPQHSRRHPRSQLPGRTWQSGTCTAPSSSILATTASRRERCLRGSGSFLTPRS